MERQYLFLCICKHLAVIQRHLQLRVFRVEVILQPFQIAAALPQTHRQVVQQVVAAGLGACGRHLLLRQYPFQTLHGQLSHILCCVIAQHNDIHPREAPHRTHIHHIILHPAVPEPSSHQVLHAVHRRWRHRRLLVRLRDAQVKRCKSLVLSRHIDSRLQPCVVYRKALYYLHNLSLSSFLFPLSTFLFHQFHERLCRLKRFLSYCVPEVMILRSIRVV